MVLVLVKRGSSNETGMATVHGLGVSTSTTTVRVRVRRVHAAAASEGLHRGWEAGKGRERHRRRRCSGTALLVWLLVRLRVELRLAVVASEAVWSHHGHAGDGRCGGGERVAGVSFRHHLVVFLILCSLSLSRASGFS